MDQAEREIESTSLELIFLPQILREYRNGRDPLVGYSVAHLCCMATGRPLSKHTVRDLVVGVKTLNGRSVAPLSEFFDAADKYIGRQLARPNMKAKAAAKARAARNVEAA